MQVKTQPEDLQSYLTDASNILGGTADKLFIPETEEAVAQILCDANENKIPVTISGARTGTGGGAIPFGGHVISLERLNKIKSIDKGARTTGVEPGAILADTQQGVEAEGLFYPPDPTEWSCQIGGTVATNASGARSFKYGATRNYVNALKVVLADGSFVELSRGQAISVNGEPIKLRTTRRHFEIKITTYTRPKVRKNVSGFFTSQPMDAVDLFIGSEGTLGVITEIELSLLPKGAGFFSGIVFFERNNDLLAFVDETKQVS